MFGRLALVLARDPFERTIEHRLSEGFGAYEEELLEVGVDAVLQGQIHQESAAEGGSHAPILQCGVQASGVVVERQKQNFLADRQHRWRP